MPGLQNLLSTVPRDTIQQISLRVHTIECIGYLLTSIKDNKELFQKDSTVIMNSLIGMQKQFSQEKDDLHHPPILIVYGQIAEAMQGDFSHYLPLVFPYVFQGLTLSIEAKIDEPLSAQTKNNTTNGKIQKVTFDLHMLGGLKTLELNTAALEQKIEAFHSLYQIANATKTSFYPYAQQTLDVLLEHMSYRNSKAIKENSIKTLVTILQALPIQERTVALNKIVPKVIQQFQNAIKIQNDEEIVLLQANLAECFKTIQSQETLNTEFGTQILQCLSESLSLCKLLKKDVKKEYANEDMDEATQEEFEEKYDEANEIMQNMIDIIGQIVRLFPTLENVVVNSILPDFFEVFTKENSTDSELNTSLCTFDEFLQYCSVQLFSKAFPDILTKFIDLAKNYQDSNVKQSSVFGIGLCAKRASVEQFTPFLNLALETLNELYTSSQSTVFENVIACIFKIALYQINDQGLKNNLFLKSFEKMPIKEDLEEACNLHELLCVLYKEQNQAFVDIMPQVKNTLLNIGNWQQQNIKTFILNEESQKYIQTL
ncbi:kap beta 3 protein, putative [Ichthyophthirius multifiliis]|uniref:Kap beta 3 protein, putative n=1 Tax=Ichthyophthirius multifiliis TaxID=5932 RepID=G0R3Y1_ICHMU|nr:kap beta 3 protein, putative [Ichthyophthirius multifiliis]EGR27812.1 kap beta 3 protein, putative [Ichthyophthirius multifiliis]|eukprot:XP_004027157.1 kap beta 3 protein, putative [Ichthyophthirius multifiliis]